MPFGRGLESMGDGKYAGVRVRLAYDLDAQRQPVRPHALSNSLAEAGTARAAGRSCADSSMRADLSEVAHAGGRSADSHDRVRTDTIDAHGTVTLRHGGKLHHIGIGRTHAWTRVLLLICDLHIHGRPCGFAVIPMS
jgi:hypothetical protein